MITLFWILLSLIVYCYFGYPILICLAAKCSRRQVEARSQHSHYVPTVSIILSVWNEEDVIKEKIENLLSLDYPREKLEILIGSDGSTDQTKDIVEQISDSRVQLFDNSVRQGKNNRNGRYIVGVL